MTPCDIRRVIEAGSVAEYYGQTGRQIDPLHLLHLLSDSYQMYKDTLIPHGHCKTCSMVYSQIIVILIMYDMM